MIIPEMKLLEVMELINNAQPPSALQPKWGNNKMSAEEMFAGVGAVDEYDVESGWLPNKVLKLGSSIKALQILIEWVVIGLIPLYAVILFFARGGIGKSTLMMMLAGCVASGRAFLGFPVKQRAVIYVDFENSLAVLSERLRSVGADEVLFWSSADSPARLDETEAQHYFDILELYPGSLFIFDTLRSSQGGDENDSKHMAEMMAVFRNLRDKGATVIVLHHTTKAANTRYKGSSAIFDMVDHVLGMYPVSQPGDETEIDEDDEEVPVYRFGTKDKTRYEPFTMYLQFNPETKLFEKAPDPAEKQLIDLRNLLIEMVSRPIDGLKQGDIITVAKDELDLSKARTMKLLSRGQDRLWSSYRGSKNARFYAPMSLFSSLPDLYTYGKQENRNPVCQVPTDGDDANCPQSPIKTEFASLSIHSQQTGNQGIVSVPPPPPMPQLTGVPL